MKFILKNMLFFLFTFVFLITGIIYSSAAQKIYLSRSQVALFRYKIPDPEGDFEEGKNRWVWIRDGLNLKSALVTDELLKGFIETQPFAKEMTLKSSNPDAGLERIKKMIDIQFTGADENNYIIEVRSPNAAFSKDLNNLLFMRLKYLAVDAVEADFNALKSQLDEQLSAMEPKSEDYTFYKNKLRKMIFRNTLEKAQRERAYQIIAMPSENNIPIWPKRGPIIIVFLFAGVVLGLFSEYIRMILKERNK